MKDDRGLVRSFGLLQATALDMSNMVGVGPFITIPLIIAAMGGPQCMLGWVLGAVLASLWSLDAVISALLTSRILIQFLAQIVALHHLRTRRSDVARPFRMRLYPVPSAIAFLGWSYIFLTSGWGFAGVMAWWIWGRVSPRNIAE